MAGTEKERGRKIAEEHRPILDLYQTMLGEMVGMMPEELQREAQAALDELKPKFEAVDEELASGALDEELARIKPPALWEFEKATLDHLVENVRKEEEDERS